SLQAIERRKRELEEPLAVVKAIRRARLSSTDRLNYDLFRRRLEEQIEGNRFKDEYLAITQLGGVQQDVGQLLAQMPTTSVQDYDNILARLNGVPALVDQAIVLLGKGLEAGITPPRVTLRELPDQIRGITPDDPMASPLLQPFAQFPPAIPATERERLTRAARDAYTQRVAPAYRKLYDYFVGSYVPKTRESIGMRELPDGATWYAYRVRQFTTTTLSPDQIHALGLREVKRIRALMDSVIASTGFKGSFADFARFLRTDPQFFYDDSASLVRAYSDIAKRADPGLIKLISKLPRLPYGVTNIPLYTAVWETRTCTQVGLHTRRAVMTALHPFLIRRLVQSGARLPRHREARRPGIDQAVRQAAAPAVRRDDDPVVHGEVADHGLLPGRLAPGGAPGLF